MLNLKEDSPIEMLRQFAVHYDADLVEDLGAAKLILNNKNGRGTITLFEVTPGLTAWVYDIKFTSKLVIDITFLKNNPYYLGYNIYGSQKQRFDNEEHYQNIKQGQNFLLKGKPGVRSQIIIPNAIDYKSCYLIINPKQLNASSKVKKRNFELDLEQVFKEKFENLPYRNLGSIDIHTGEFAKILIKNKRTDLVGRLHTEGAILNMLASQIDSYQKRDKKKQSIDTPLSDQELSRLVELGDFVLNNIDKKISVDMISNHIQLSSKKIQKGLKFLYGFSANEYVINVKLSHAKELIHYTNNTISEICYCVGFNSKSYFSKIFRQRYGLLPSEYRKKFESEFEFYEVTYRSLAVPKISEFDVDSILITARNMNPKFQVTGCIVYYKNVFFQQIEGPKENVLKLFSNIQKDNRNEDVQTMWQGFKNKRDFSSWAMASITDNGLLTVSQQGRARELELDHLIKNIDTSELVSKNLWKRVRNVMKTSY